MVWSERFHMKLEICLFIWLKLECLRGRMLTPHSNRKLHSHIKAWTSRRYSSCTLPHSVCTHENQWCFQPSGKINAPWPRALKLGISFFVLLSCEVGMCYIVVMFYLILMVRILDLPVYTPINVFRYLRWFFNSYPHSICIVFVTVIFSCVHERPLTIICLKYTQSPRDSS